MRRMRWAAFVMTLIVGDRLVRSVGASWFPRGLLEDQGAEMVVQESNQYTSHICDGIPSTAAGTDETYSVIIVSNNGHRSNLFRDERRMCTYSSGVVSVQIADPDPADDFGSTSDYRPFYVGHPVGVSKRIRVYHTGNSKNRPHAVSHVRAACADTSESTIILLTDEYCKEKPLTKTLPGACWTNFARHYPYSAPSPREEERYSYIPLGPRDSFPFVDASERARLGSERPMFFNIAARDATAPRRVRLGNITEEFHRKHPTLNAFINEKILGAKEYRSMLLNSTFTLCPGGHNPETFRMFEALESGSIPIVSRRDYLYPSYEAPFPCGEGEASWNTVAASPFAQAVSVGSWDEVPELLERLMNSPAEYIDKLQADCVAWYEALMRRTYKSMLNFGQGYELWPQSGPIVLDGFPAPSKPYGETPPYDPEEL